MLKKLILVLTLLSIYYAQSPCEPYGLRIYYGDIVTSQTSSERLIIYFNTKDNCPNSYVNLITKSGFRKVICESKSVTTSAFANFYTTYIQRCSLSDVPFDQAISYTAYGWDIIRSSNPTPHKRQWIDFTLADPRSKDRQVQVVVLADWGVIKDNLPVMTPITTDLKKTLLDKKIDAVMIAGDIAYDLDSNNGTTYEGFLLLMEEISASYPFFIAPGNHERKTVDANLLFRQSFKTYGIENNLAAGIYFGSLFLTMFDPYGILYNRPEPVSSLQGLRVELQKGLQSGRFIVPYSHYAMICSGQYVLCLDKFTKMQAYFDLMLEKQVVLYLGAHTHTYQRSYPYYNNRSFEIKEPPYTQNEGQYLISIVEGVAGSDTSIITDMPDLQKLTAKYTVNQTGYGVLVSNVNFVTYEHYSTKQGWMDQVLISRIPGTVKTSSSNLRISKE